MENLKIALHEKIAEFQKILQELVEKHQKISTEQGIMSPQSVSTLFELNTLNSMIDAWNRVIEYIEVVEMNAAELPKL